MITKDLLLYLQSKTAITSLVGMRIYIGQAPGTEPAPLMPWVVLEVPAGERYQLTNTLTEVLTYVRVTVDVGPNQLVLGGTIAEACLRALENYRGLMGTSNDMFVTCGAIRNWAGIGGAHRYQFECKIIYTETKQTPA